MADSEDGKVWLIGRVRDDVYDFVRDHWVRAIIVLISSGGATLSYIKSCEILAVGLGAAALMLLAISALAVHDGSKRRRLSRSLNAADSEIETKVVPNEEIRFDYLPDSPLNHNWKQGYSTNPVPPNSTWKVPIHAPSGGGMLIKLSDKGCAIDYAIGASSALSTRLVCDAKFNDGAMLFLRVRLLTRDKSKNRSGFIKFELGS